MEQSQTSSAVIPHLPNEVMIKILSYIILSRDLASAALASRNINALVQDFLYRSISLNVSHSTKKIKSLIERLSANPELGLQTDALSLTLPIEGWFGSYEHNRLLQCLPNLQHVAFNPPPWMCSIPEGFHPPEICFGDQYKTTENVVISTDLVGFFQIPKLRRLVFEDLHFRCDDLDEPDTLVRRAISRLNLSSRRTPVEDLRFIDCGDEEHGLNFEGIIAQVEALKRFVFVTCKYARHERALGGMARALTRHIAHLEELVISPQDSTYGGYIAIEWFFNHCFTNLRRVAVPKCLLIQDIDRRSQCVLPRTVEEVQIQFGFTCDGYGAVEAIDSALENIDGEGYGVSEADDQAHESDVAAVEWLLTAKSETLPNLKRVIWWYQAPKHYICDGSLPDLQRLYKQFADANVRFEWTIVQAFRDTPFGRRLID